MIATASEVPEIYAAVSEFINTTELPNTYTGDLDALITKLIDTDNDGCHEMLRELGFDFWATARIAGGIARAVVNTATALGL